MLEQDVVACPICHKELFVKFINQKTIVYIVPEDCPHCKTNCDKLETMLNKSNKRTHQPTSTSYLKGADPKGGR